MKKSATLLAPAVLATLVSGVIGTTTMGCGLFQSLDSAEYTGGTGTEAGTDVSDSGETDAKDAANDSSNDAGLDAPADIGTDGEAGVIDSGTPDAGPPKIVITPSPGDLGEAHKGHVGEPVTFTVKNVFSAPIGPLLMVRAGSDAGLFELTDDTCSKIVLSPNSTCTVSVRFRPKDYGERTIQLMAMAGSEPFGQADIVARTPDLFVSTTGSDSDNGYRPDHPLKTITKAFDILKSKQYLWIHVGPGEFVGATKGAGAVTVPVAMKMSGAGKDKTTVTLDQAHWEVLSSAKLEDFTLKTLSRGEALVSKGHELSLQSVDISCGESGTQGSVPYQGACLSAQGGTSGSVVIHSADIRCNGMQTCIRAEYGTYIHMSDKTTVTMSKGDYGVYVNNNATFSGASNEVSLSCSDFREACISAQGYPGYIPEVTCGANPAIGVEIRGNATQTSDTLSVKATACDVGLRMAGKQDDLSNLMLTIVDSLTTGVLIDSDFDSSAQTFSQLYIGSSNEMSVIKSSAPHAIGLDVRSKNIGWMPDPQGGGGPAGVYAPYVEWNHNVQGADSSGRYPSGTSKTGPIARQDGNNFAIIDGSTLRL